EKIEPRALALGTGTVSRRQRRGFVQEKQLCVPSRRHDWPLPSLELQPADDPAFALKGAADCAVLVVQATAVAHERTARRRCDQAAKRCDTVLERHGAFDAIYNNSSISASS